MKTETILLEPELEIEALEAAIEGVEEWPVDRSMQFLWYSNGFVAGNITEKVAKCSKFG